MGWRYIVVDGGLDTIGSGQKCSHDRYAHSDCEQCTIEVERLAASQWLKQRSAYPETVEGIALGRHMDWAEKNLRR